jgi:drug/metabolite transporter (DMT)-like permease
VGGHVSVRARPGAGNRETHRITVLLVVGLGLLAALLFAVSASLQQHAARREADGVDDLPGGALGSVLLSIVRLVRRLVRDRLWLIGWGTNLAGFMTQAAALHLGSVALVQPLLVAQLLFALPLASGWRRRRPTGRDWLAAGAICGGLVIFLMVRGVAPLPGAADRPRVILAGLATAVLVGALLVISGRRSPPVRATILAVAAGLCFAMTAVLIKLTADDLLVRGVAATAVDWPGYALAVSTLSGLLLEQGAFGAGTLPGAVAAMTITNPVTGYLAGIMAFHVAPPTGLGPLAALAGAAVLLCAGAVGLAHSPEVRAEIRDTGDAGPRIPGGGAGDSERAGTLPRHIPRGSPPGIGGQGRRLAKGTGKTWRE